MLLSNTWLWALAAESWSSSEYKRPWTIVSSLSSDSAAKRWDVNWDVELPPASKLSGTVSISIVMFSFAKNHAFFQHDRREFLYVAKNKQNVGLEFSKQSMDDCKPVLILLFFSDAICYASISNWQFETNCPSKFAFHMDHEFH